MNVTGYTGVALNQSPDSKNEIHGDRIAKVYGFKGGLVPGVTLSAYLTQPAVEAWGLDWLNTGRSHIAVRSPVYDRENFAVAITDQSEFQYTAELLNSSGRICATAEVSLEQGAAIAPIRRGDGIAEAGYQPPRASKDWFEQLKDLGCYAFRYQWQEDHRMSRYFEDVAHMPMLLRFPGEAAAGLKDNNRGNAKGFANMSFILGCANWIFDSNAAMNPWVHLETRSKNYSAISPGTSVIVEMQVLDEFSKKGHQFCDINVAVFDEQSGQCFSEVFQRAIYRLRGM